jgi:hypothetical protein
VTISDTDLEARLRDLRTRADEVPPAPFDLARRVRDRHRAQRRRELRVAAGGLVAALVFVGLPMVASSPVAEPEPGQTATPRERTFVPTPTLLEQPTRGSLADDEDWLAGVAGLSWLPEGAEELPYDTGWVEPPPADRKVAFAGDVAGVRVALVLARDGNRLHHVWYTGPQGAEPGAMILALGPSDTPGGRTVGLIDVPDRESDEALLIVVSFPDSHARFMTGYAVGADGQETETWVELPAEDGIAVASVPRPYGWGTSSRLRISGGGSINEQLLPEFSTRADEAAREPIDVADPRGLRPTVGEEQVQSVLQAIVSHVGLPPDRVAPTLLAAGPLGDASDNTAVLVGVTLPSGASLTAWMTYRGEPNSAEGVSGTYGMMRPAPAGTPLLERVIAVPAAGSPALVVSGPSAGVTAEVLDGTGALLATLPLVDGAGTGPHAPRPAASVRIRDADGAVIAEGPVQAHS